MIQVAAKLHICIPTLYCSTLFFSFFFYFSVRPLSILNVSIVALNSFRFCDRNIPSQTDSRKLYGTKFLNRKLNIRADFLLMTPVFRFHFKVSVYLR
jgi:hypothetical protein